MQHSAAENVGDNLTFFTRLQDDEEVEETNNSGVISSFLSRLWRTEGNGSAEPVPPRSNTVEVINVNPQNVNETKDSEASEPSCSALSNQTPDNVSIGSTDSDKKRMLPSKLTNIFKGGKPKPGRGLVDYNRSNFKQYWMPDSTGKECYQCEERFTTLRRRHHCRLCGQIFCSKCCSIHVPGATLGYTGDLRLCDYCAKMMAQYLPPEADMRQGSEEMNTSAVSALSTSFSQEDTMLPEQPSASSVISTVSGGSLMWSRPPDIKSSPTERENSLSFPSKVPQESLTLLSVQDLYAQHEGALNTNRRNLTSNSLCEEEESGPDWFRNMDSGQNSSSNLVKEELAVVPPQHDIARISTVDFDSISPLDFSESRDIGKESIDRKISNPLSGRAMQNFDGDIDRSFDQRADVMLDYLFRRECISDERWKPIIRTLARRISGTLRIDVDKAKDSMNILSYVHVKKLNVCEEAPSAETLWGVVCTKSVVHSSMNAELQNASVMIVAGSIEYERIQDKLSSIDPIICQESEFLSKQVDRILARRPSLLLVEGVVSRIAVQLLNKAGVAVVINVKKNVLRRVARCTGADVLPSSDAQLIQQNIGFCPVFKQDVYSLKNGHKKILLTFNDCPAERGCSVLLRGNNMRELKAVKRVLHFMISLIYSSRLEKSYLALFGCRIAVDEECSCEVCITRAENIENTVDQSKFELALSDSILGLSPFIRYEPPFLETNRGRNCTLLPYFKQPLYRYGIDEDFKLLAREEEEEITNKENDEKMIPAPTIPRHQFIAKPTEELTENLAGFRAMGGRIFRRRINGYKNGSSTAVRRTSMDKVRFNNVLCPIVHQRVAVLFGSFSPKSPNAPSFCVRPWVLSIEFYGNHDMTLGEFLTKYCFNKLYECPSANCEVPMLDHSRKLVYGRICVEVSTQVVVQNGTNVDDPALTNSNGQILCWNYCSSCKASSPVQPMNSSVWHLSFGKYLDYLSNSAFSKGAISSPLQNQCNHCFFHQHTHFFSQQNFVTTFKITPIRPFDVQFSPVICRIIPQQFSRQALIDGVTRMAALAEDIVQLADDRLKVFVQHENFSQYAGTFHTVLRQLVDNTSSLVKQHKVYADTLVSLDRQIIPSNDLYAVKSNETMMYIREGIYNLITTWNDQCNVLGATMRTMKKEDGSSADATDISLDKIDDPFPAYLHLGLKLQSRVGVVVRDIQDNRGVYKPDIGSIIAYALSSANYEEGRKRARSQAGAEDIPLNLNSSSLPQDDASLAAEHLEIEFQDQNTAYYVKAYYAERFRLLRKLLVAEGEDAFIRSLSQTTFWTPQGGKSGSFFYRTQDDRFIVKQMSRFEIQSFVKFAPNYFEYIKTAVTEHKLTTLCKVHGVFRVGVKSKTTQLKVDILVMEYLFYKHNVDRVWDLKGSLRNRMATAGNNPSDVLLDENLMSDLWNNQLYVYPHSKAALNQAISNDSHFLSAQHVMDYSLLVGVDETNGQLILGIVDYMRTYTLDKKLESWVKIVAIPGAHLPTILSPELYCNRFSEAIDTYFPVVPDQWTGLGSVVSY